MAPGVDLPGSFLPPAEEQDETCMPVYVSAISQYDNWDHRECAVANVIEWKTLVARYMQSMPPIPKVIHQIWIGPREPPCVWLDTWRVRYLGGVGKGWGYQLWSDREVRSLDMINADLYKSEPMWQCKADILRLEVLYKYGGVYIDADMVSLGKSLDQVLESARDTGFAITFEPDTKDKPYSVLGNSVIFASPGHPLVLMLIQYIKTIYPHKRPHHSVEWVTGPLAFTKCLIHTGMPFTTPSPSLFYPQFHYVPNPDAIDMTSFPDAVSFQFGYTCSGLENWVKLNNRCRRASSCPYHSSKKDYPFGPLLKIPKAIGLQGSNMGTLKVPRMIHQIYFGEERTSPVKWTKTWSEDFVTDHPGWSYKLWNKKSIAGLGGFFASNMYFDPQKRRMDDSTLALLAMEILYKLGGFFVPLSAMYIRSGFDSQKDGLLFPPEENSEHFTVGSISAAPPKSPAVLNRIKMMYESPEEETFEKPEVVKDFKNVAQVGYGDGVCSYFTFPDKGNSWKDYRLGSISAVAFLVGPGSRFDNFCSSESAVMSWAYRSEIPMFRSSNLVDIGRRVPEGAVLVIVRKDIALWTSLEASLPHLLEQADKYHATWNFLALGVEWNTGYDAYQLEGVHHVDREAPRLCGFIAKSGSLCDLLADTPVESLSDALWDMGMSGERNVVAGVEKVAQSEELSRLTRAQPLVAKVLKTVADHHIPPWDAETTEVHGDLMKATSQGRLLYEFSVDQERRVMYRAWNDDGGMNCEVKMILQGNSSAMVEWARVYFAHQVIYEGNGVLVHWL